MNSKNQFMQLDISVFSIVVRHTIFDNFFDWWTNIYSNIILAHLQFQKYYYKYNHYLPKEEWYFFSW